MRSAVLDHALSHADKHRQADTPQTAAFRLWGRGGLTASPPVGAYHAPASVKRYYAGKLQMTPGNSAFYAKILPNIIFSFISA